MEITLTDTDASSGRVGRVAIPARRTLQLRCTIILRFEDPNLTGTDIAGTLGCNPVTVSKWRKRFAESRLDGLIEEPPLGAARTITDDILDRLGRYYTSLSPKTNYPTNQPDRTRERCSDTIRVSSLAPHHDELPVSLSRAA